METLQDRIRAHCVGHPYAKVAWPHRVLNEAADELDRLATLEAALRTIQSAAAGYVHPQRRVSAEELIDIVLKEADSAKVNKALEKGK